MGLKQQVEVAHENIITLIIDHHDVLRSAFDVLKDEDASQNTKKISLLQFIETLKMHSKAEEHTLYERLKDIKAFRKQAFESEEEHKIADRLVHELETLDFKDHWSDKIQAKAKVLAELVENHVEEEEQFLFPRVKKHLSREELERLGADYAKRCENLMQSIVAGPNIDAEPEELESISKDDEVENLVKEEIERPEEHTRIYEGRI